MGTIGYEVAGHKPTCATGRNGTTEGLISVILDPGYSSLDARVPSSYGGHLDWDFANFSLLSR